VRVDLPVTEGHICDDLVHAEGRRGRGRLALELLTDRARRLDPFGAQERMGAGLARVELGEDRCEDGECRERDPDDGSCDADGTPKDARDDPALEGEDFARDGEQSEHDRASKA
jgi:hypothetical protein